MTHTKAAAQWQGVVTRQAILHRSACSARALCLWCIVVRSIFVSADDWIIHRTAARDRASGLMQDGCQWVTYAHGAKHTLGWFSMTVYTLLISNGIGQDDHERAGQTSTSGRIIRRTFDICCEFHSSPINCGQYFTLTPKCQPYGHVRPVRSDFILTS